MNVAVDVGNSSIKWSVIPEKVDLTDSAKWQPQRWPQKPDATFGSMPEPAVWWISSVNQTAFDQVVETLRRVRPHDELRHVERDDLALTINVDRPEQVGMDRLLGALAVAHRCDENESTIFVDFGTATTINLVHGKGRFDGGLILPGVQTQLNALSDATDQLPDLTWQNEGFRSELIGKNTTEAILTGTIRGHMAAVESLTLQIKSSIPHCHSMWFTGGGVPSMDWCDSIGATFIPQLVLEGIGRCAALD